MDKIEKLAGALIQHGKNSDRIYLMKMAEAEPDILIKELDLLAQKNGYSKIFAKVPATAQESFLKAGYKKEGKVSGYYNGKETVFFLAKFFDAKRASSQNQEQLKKVIKLAESKAKTPAKKINPNYKIIKCGPENCQEMAQVYQQVFANYPFPIHDPEYLKKTMATHIIYFAVVKEGKIIALSSAEIDWQAQAVEMTDFATLPSERGQGLAYHLLKRMEQEMISQKIKTAYTIARALEAGMNITFARAGYKYSGTLVNNTAIASSIESMNVWVKQLLISR